MELNDEISYLEYLGVFIHNRCHDSTNYGMIITKHKSPRKRFRCSDCLHSLSNSSELLIRLTLANRGPDWDGSTTITLDSISDSVITSANKD